MTDEQIIKALECCTLTNGNCSQCPLNIEDSADCFKFTIQKHSLDLINRQKAEIDRFADIGKMYSEVRAEAIREFAEKIDQLLNRYSNLHKYADKAMESTEKYDDGTPIEMVSVWEVKTIEKWEMDDYETMSKLQGNIETIAQERLLSGLERDFRLLVKEMTEEQP